VCRRCVGIALEMCGKCAGSEWGMYRVCEEIAWEMCAKCSGSVGGSCFGSGRECGIEHEHLQNGTQRRFEVVREGLK